MAYLWLGIREKGIIMTCIVGIAKDGKVYMGGDSFVSYDSRHQVSSKKKVFKTGQFLIGYTGSTRMGDLLRFELDVDRFDISVESRLEYMVKVFIPAIRKLFQDGGYSKIVNNEEVGGQFLVGFKGELFEIDTDFQVERYLKDYSAVGSGSPYAFGVLFTLARNEYDPVEVIYQALEAAGEFDNFVGAPYYVLQE